MTLSVIAVAVAAVGASSEPPRITFSNAIQQALAKNPTVTSALEDIARAKALVEQTRAPSLPSLTGTGSYTRLDADRKLADRVIVSANSISANMQLALPLVQPPRWVQWSHAAKDVDVARLSVEDVRRQLALAVARAYLTTVSQRRTADVLSRARDTAQAHHAFANERLTGGVGNRLDEVRAAQALAADEVQVQLALTNLWRAQEALGVLVGTDGPLDASEDPSLGDLPSAELALDEARDRRSDVRAQRARLDSAERAVDDGWTDYAPSVLALLQPFFQNPASLTQPQNGWQAQLILTLPFYDGGLRSAQSHDRAAVAAKTRAALEGTLLQARSEVRSAFEEVRRADVALRAARDAAKLAAESFDLAKFAYERGAVNNLEVVDAERTARDADAAVASAEDGARQARVDLLAASGRFP